MATATREILNSLNIANFGIPTITISSIVDILLVAYLVYIVLIFIKETRAWSLFKGIIMLIAISIFAYVFNLYTVSKIISSAFNVGLIALIVLFQPELRKALEQIGKGDFITQFVKPDSTDYKLSEKSVDEVVDVVKKLAKSRTGALLVLEKSVALGDLEQTGIKVDSVISSQLIGNIFVDKTPLHDGAVIIRNNRIAAACCILPLTSAEIGKELGTRHRAGVGASEVCDGLVIIVSEETGSISVAESGKLRQKLSEDELKKRLLGNENSKKRVLIWKGRRKK